MFAHLENTPRSSTHGTVLMRSAAMVPRPTPLHLSRASRPCYASLLTLLLGNLPPYALGLTDSSTPISTRPRSPITSGTAGDCSYTAFFSSRDCALESSGYALLENGRSDNKSAAAARRANSHRPRARARLGTFSAGAPPRLNTVWCAFRVARNVLCLFCGVSRLRLDHDSVSHLVRLHC